MTNCLLAAPIVLLNACLQGPAVESPTPTPSASPPAEVREVRARDLGIPFDGTPGTWNAITDVPGVLVGHTTLVEGEGEHAVRTGVTAILPAGTIRPVFAATHCLNGEGELTGSHHIREKGYLFSPILLTGTTSVGRVHEATLRWSLESDRAPYEIDLAVVGETWDGYLTDRHGRRITDEEVSGALDGARSGPVAEGNVGGGTGMVAHGFKAGIGTASRVLPGALGEYTVGVLVQANYGLREELRIAGVPVGREIPDLLPEIHSDPGEGGSILVVLATDVPLLPHQLRRVAQRVTMGLARCGSYASTYSGDLFLAFSTAAFDDRESSPLITAEYLKDSRMDAVFLATVQATEEAIVNALVAARTVIGVHGNRVHALPHDELRDVLREYRRLEER